jgi:hypothetical protein
MAKKSRKAQLDSSDEDSMMTAIGEEPGKKPKQEETPTYRMIGESKIPVSKVRGKMWKSRRDERMKNMGDTFDAWEEAESYYHATQDEYRRKRDTDSVSKAAPIRQRKNRILTEQENIIFANTAALVPMLYAKNPEVTTTGTNDDMKPLYECIEELGNKIISRKTYPGVNLKPKVKKCVLSAALSNEGWIEFGWTFKEESSEQALADLKKISDEMSKTKDLRVLKELEGKLMALEAKIEVLTPAGPWAKYRRPNQILVDPNTENDDCTDSNWIMVWDMVPTNALNAMYADKDENGNWKSVYEPTHRMETASNQGSNVDEQVKNFRLFTNTDAKDQQRDKTLDITKVWYIYDKVTRRIELYSDANWSWPIWVFEDRLRLQKFFPLERLAFHTSPSSTRMKGEVSYYLDQQDSINEINDAEARARDMVKNNGFFDKNFGINDKELAEVLNGPDGTMKGLTVPDGKKIDDLMVTPTPDFLKYPTLFDDAAKNRKFAAIDRIASVNDVQRGGQFKTNTTNKAIDTYNSITNTRLDDRIDAIEDFVGDITWGIIQLCLQYMPQEVVTILVGPKRAKVWKNMEPEEILTTFASIRVDGGSTQKPTSKAKKSEAIELMQVLGQFVQAAPTAVTKILFRVGERAFDEWVMKDTDWDDLNNELQFRETQEGGQPAEAGDGEQPMTPAIEQAIGQLPPEAQKAVMNAIQQGVPAETAIEEVMKLLQNAQMQEQTEQPPTVQ